MNKNREEIKNMKTENRKIRLKRGYKSRATQPAIRAVVNEVRAWQALSDELLEKIYRLPSGTVTVTEVVKDFGASSSGRKLFEQAGWLVPAGSLGRRKAYQLHEVLRAAVLLSGLFRAPQTRIVRKRKDNRNGSKNIVTVTRETVRRMLRPK
jgi:hypothetical protein